MKKINRLVFIDDSGDPGFSFDKGSSRFFVLAAIIFDDIEESKKVYFFIRCLLEDMRLKSDSEFKFNKLNRKIRRKFLLKVRRFNFTIDCLIVDKVKLESKNSLYSRAIGDLLFKSGDFITGAKIKIDGAVNSKLKNELTKYIGKDTRLAFTKSTDSLIQLADMIAGSIRRSYESRKEDKDDYISIFRKKIRNKWLF